MLAFNDSCSLPMRKGETVERLDERVTYTMTDDIKNGIRTPLFVAFEMLLNGIKHGFPTTYALVREITSVPCMDVNAAIQGRKLMLKSPEINRFDLLKEQTRERIALQSSSM